jgi:hypothetical protein
MNADELADGASPCPALEGLLGCTRESVGYGVPSSLQHELVHAALHGTGLPPPLFGSAKALPSRRRVSPSRGSVQVRRTAIGDII